MLEKTIKLYTFEELNENVKQRAADNYRATWDCIPWLDETKASLQAYAEFLTLSMILTIIIELILT